MIPYIRHCNLRRVLRGLVILYQVALLYHNGRISWLVYGILSVLVYPIPTVTYIL